MTRVDCRHLTTCACMAGSIAEIRQNMPFIDVIAYDRASADLRQIYDNLIASRGKLANVHMIQSLNPPTIVSHMSLYTDIMFGPSPLERYQREMLGVVVSATNECDYCVDQHRNALLHFWRDEQQADALIAGAVPAGIDQADLELCAFARRLSLVPGLSGNDQIASLRALGFSDRAILDATLVIAYFNFVNRVVKALGVVVDDEESGGYRYG